MTEETKRLLAIMAATIYGQSKTLRVPECVSLAAEIWNEIEMKHPEEDLESGTVHCAHLRITERGICKDCGMSAHHPNL
jgi:hypothetical protein